MNPILKVLAILVFLYSSSFINYNLTASENEFYIPTDVNRYDSLSLQQALSLVFRDNPQLEVSELESEAAAARIVQAEIKPNPELSLEADNFPALNGEGIAGYLESTIQVSQRLEIGGKRNRRIKAAKSFKSMTEFATEVRKAELRADVARAFYDVLAAQERIGNQQELARLSQQSLNVVLERIAAGKVSPVEQTLAQMELVSAQLEEEEQKKNLIAAKNRLAALWGGSSGDFGKASGQFEIPPEPTSLGQSCPDMVLAESTIDFRQKTLASEQAARNPDITISGGYKHLKPENVNALVFGVSLPLPIFDKRQGAISEASILLHKATSERNALKRRLRADLALARHEREIALLEADTLSQNALPTAMEAISAIQEGYSLGKFTLMNVLDAQRTHAQLRQRYIEAVASGLQATVDIHRLVDCDSGSEASVGVTDTEGVYNEK